MKTADDYMPWFFRGLLIFCLSIFYLSSSLWNNSYWIIKGFVTFIIITSGMCTLGSAMLIHELPTKSQLEEENRKKDN